MAEATTVDVLVISRATITALEKQLAQLKVSADLVAVASNEHQLSRADGFGPPSAESVCERAATVFRRPTRWFNNRPSRPPSCG